MQTAGNKQHAGSFVRAAFKQLDLGCLEQAACRELGMQGSIQAAWPRQHSGSLEQAACRLEQAAYKQLYAGSKQIACLSSMRET
jgi:hypothetical protein